MVYGIIGMINFAHGEIYMIGAYVGLVTLTSIGTNSGLPVPFIIAAMLLVAIVVTGIYGFPSNAWLTGRCATAPGWSR